MNTIDIIRAEIERRIEESRTRQKNLEYIGQENANIVEEHIRATLKAILSFLSTLESEKPMNKDELIEEVKRYYSDNFAYLSSDQPTLSILTNVARHFAQWGAEHLKK